MVAAYQRVDINTHSGGVSHISMPVHAVNDVEGTIYLVSSDNSRGAPNLLVNILNEDNEVVAQTRTESDGYFYISQLAPGEYKMSVDQDYLERNALFIDSEQLSFVAPEEGDAIFHIAKFRNLEIAENKMEYFNEDAIKQSEFYELNNEEIIE